MSNAEDEFPDFEDPSFEDGDMPGDDRAAPQPSDAADQRGSPQAEADVTPELKDETEGKKGKRRKGKKGRKEKGEKRKKEKKPSREGKQKKSKEVGGEKQGGGLLAALRQASPYTVMLGLALLAILIGIFCHFMELQRYDLDIKAEKAKRPTAMAPTLQFGPASTTETAWPIGVQLTTRAGDLSELSGRPWITSTGHSGSGRS